MKILIATVFAAVLLIPFHSEGGILKQQEIFSKQGYPYNILLRKTNSIKIHYVESAQNINCYVNLEFDGKKEKTAVLSISKKAFLTASLKNCLRRNKAKEILKATFS